MEDIDPGSVAQTETWNGTSWTELNDLNTCKICSRWIGTVNNTALCFSGGRDFHGQQQHKQNHGMEQVGLK